MIEMPIAVMSGARRGALPQRTVRDALHAVADGHADRHGAGHRDAHDEEWRHPGDGLREGPDHRQGDHRTDHHHFAVGEIDELDDAVDHRVAEGHDGIHAAQREAVDELLEEDVQGVGDLADGAGTKENSTRGCRFRGCGGRTRAL
jgi:hypothetical protein